MHDMCAHSTYNKINQLSYDSGKGKVLPKHKFGDVIIRNIPGHAVKHGRVKNLPGQHISAPCTVCDYKTWGGRSRERPKMPEHPERNPLLPNPEYVQMTLGTCGRYTRSLSLSCECRVNFSSVGGDVKRKIKKCWPYLFTANNWGIPSACRLSVDRMYLMLFVIIRTGVFTRVIVECRLVYPGYPYGLQSLSEYHYVPCSLNFICCRS